MTTTTHTPDAIELLCADLALIGRTPTLADIQATMQIGHQPAKYMIRVDGKPVRFAINRLAARVAARSAGHLHPEAIIEVEYRTTGERAVAALDGSFCHVEGAYHWAPAVAQTA